ncbi:MAG: nuclear transport factor 2 family protein [Caulobacteraceae bacterium]|nr:nuclear transport factor 2 family protein [Caulobacteraceae bacterium]
MANPESIEARLERLEAINDIRNVMADYCHYYDTGWDGAGRDPDKVGELFLEDGVWEGGMAGRHVGRKTIRDWCANLGHAADMSCHIVMNPKIEVDGDKAKGSWAGFIPLISPDKEALWICGRYECDFARKDGAWKIAVLRFFTAFQTPYEEGFGKVRYHRSDRYERALPS